MELTWYQTMLLTFVGSFIATAVAVIFATRMIPSFANLWPRFAVFLQKRAFPLTSGQERNKFALLRIVFGLIIFTRAVDVAKNTLPMLASSTAWS
jgi:hypothetical protein